MRLIRPTCFHTGSSPEIPADQDMFFSKGSGMVYFEGGNVIASDQYIVVIRPIRAMMQWDEGEGDIPKMLDGKCVHWEAFPDLAKPHYLSPKGDEMYDDDFESTIALIDSSRYPEFRRKMLKAIEVFDKAKSNPVTELPFNWYFLRKIMTALDFEEGDRVLLLGKGRDKPFGVKRHGSNLPEMGLMLAADVSPEDRDHGRE